MTLNKPPANDAERLATLIQDICGPDDDDMTEEETRAEARTAGVDFAAWADEIRTLATAAAGMVILVYGQLVSQHPYNAGAPNVKLPAPSMSDLPAGPTQSTDAGAPSAATEGKTKKRGRPDSPPPPQ
jgi:hypothetical protein